MRRVGVYSGLPDEPVGRAYFMAFKSKLEALGWSEGRNVQIDYRLAAGDADRVSALAAEMVGTKPDVILAVTPSALLALRGKTSTIPLVFANVSDPVDGGLVASMARPGGNITGFTSFEYSLSGKWLELLKEAVPTLARALVLFNPDNYTSRALLRTIESLAPAAGVPVIAAAVHDGAEIEAAIASFAKAPNGGIILLPDPATTINEKKIITLALTHRLPAIQQSRFFPAAGWLMSYGTDFLDVYQRAASYVDRILKGAKVGELPVQNPVKFELVINLKTAKALGLDLPWFLQQRADEVIE
jgi:putative ABC transport system substrate-binding protein